MAGVKRIVGLMEHIAKGHTHKILLKCDLPLTGVPVIDRIITELCVPDITELGLKLVEIARDVSGAEVRAKAAPVLMAARR